ncbi:G2 and S phase-expressed protein 1 isoform X3 [Rana temporaria]|uniref:G2 and S phase-expressed protein 1 isoform X3 n=1 Tax=Rana temporaria TaxID=8407 RepID=UPI001AAD5882|nr:G2 and S phase-expressed protein 1 isoform X3 [Rana temporaria]
MDAGNFTFLEDEKFDFDVSLSPSSAKDTEDCEDEVFIGPVKHKEKCVSASIQLHESDKAPLPDDQGVWSPLSGDKFVEIFKEAHLLALQLECSASDDKKEPLQTVPNPVVEKFVQESKSKLKLFDTLNGVNKTPIAIKRETYCIQDSPLHQLPPSVQQQIVGPNTDAQRSQSLTSPKAAKVVKCLLVSPLAQKAKAPQVKSTVSSLGIGKMVSRLQPIKANSAQSNKNSLTVEKLPLGKTQFKTPSAAPSLRKNTSSSSSSHSSVNTSLNSSSSSPPAASAKRNASLNTSLSTSINGSRLKPNMNKLVRPLGGIGSTLKMASSDVNNRLKPNAVAKTNGNKPASVSMAQPHTPAGKFQRQTSAPNLLRLLPPAKPESGVKMSTKPQARIMPTPTSRLKPPQKSEGLSPEGTTRRSLKPTRLLSCGEIGSAIVQSTPMGAAKGMNSSFIGRCISATPSSKRTSALPTPVSRRTSGILTTPRTVPRAIPSFRPTPAFQTSSKSSKKLIVGSECEQTKPKLSCSPISPTEDHIAAEICCSLNFSPENKSEKQQAVTIPQRTEVMHFQVLLIDIEVEKANTKIRKQVSIENDSQPLIDLSNTPDQNKQPILLKPTHVTQLIDFGSPLIKLSPAANKENMDSPLLKF